MKALIIIDIQNDFLPDGALAVADGNSIIPVVNQLQEKFELIVATQDWHPSDHGSFAANHPEREIGDFVNLNGVHQILWPVHCVQGTKGSAFHSDLNMQRWKAVFRKGTDPMVDSYSGFFDNNRKGDTGLSGFLKSSGAVEIYVCGLAADYCVKFTALDGVREGFKTYLIIDATKAVNAQQGDFEKSIEEMKKEGVIIVNSHQIN